MVVCHRKDLFVLFDFQLYVSRQVAFKLCQQSVKRLFVAMQYYNVVGVSEIVPYPLYFLYPMVEVGKYKIR